MKKEAWLEEFLERLNNIEDNREEWKVLHKIGDIIAICIISTLANCDRMKDIQIWATYHTDLLGKYLELPNGIPGYDTMRRVMGSVSPQYLNNFLQQWNELLAMNQKGKLRKILAIDGKTQRGNATAKQKPNHIVSAVDENKLCWGQERVSDKSNEITAIPKLLDRLNIEKQIVTTDAMGTQKDIVKKIIEKKGDYVLALKGNQHNFYDEVKLYFEDKEFLGKSAKHHTTEKARGGIERREYWQTDDVSWLAQRDEWEGLKSIGMTRNTTTKNGKTTVETRYFISSLGIDAPLFARAIRSHWQVESYHWLLDTTLREDESPVLDKQCAENLNIIRKFVLAILKTAQIGDKYTSLRGKRLHIACDPIGFMEKLFEI
ncbi:MAG: ISAs1 family transposase [Chitinispirillales bacterium]|nr:ISAs1 family transposase [Chitinispirillales bacterium]